jgi:hypothetical protein
LVASVARPSPTSPTTCNTGLPKRDSSWTESQTAWPEMTRVAEVTATPMSYLSSISFGVVGPTTRATSPTKTLGPASAIRWYRHTGFWYDPG